MSRVLSLTVVLVGCVSFADVEPGTGTGRHGTRTIDSVTTVNRGARLSSALSAGASALVVDVPDAFEAGDLLLLFTAQAETALGEDGDAVRLDESTGRFAFTRVRAVAGTSITLDDTLVAAWPSHTQVVFVPEFEGLTVTSTGVVEALAWNGETSGLLALLVRGRLTLDGRLSADGKGFRGGAPFDEQGVAVGGAGEGLTRGLWPRLSDVRSASLGGAPGATGGTGTSGGGGGNSTRGGFAPFSFHVDSGQALGGRGGLAIAPTLGQRLLFGGGAAACRLGPTSCGRGGHGGGAIVLHAGDIDGAGVISANGTIGTDRMIPNRGWVRGSGGAGGSIVVRSASNVAVGAVEARGADGTSEPSCCSAGAAGGAGRVFVRAAQVTARVTATSGVSGLVAGERRDGLPTMTEAGEVDVRTEPLDAPKPKLGFFVGCSSAPSAFGWVLGLLVLMRRATRRLG